MKKRRMIAAVLASVLMLGGCSEQENQEGDTVAYVNGCAVTLEEYSQYAYDSISLSQRSSAGITALIPTRKIFGPLPVRGKRRWMF